jgi:hypothetical protein
MKFIIGALTMILAATPSNSFSMPTPDEAAIETIVESVATLADRENFESLEKLYADEIRVDYKYLSKMNYTKTQVQRYTKN